MDCRTARQLLEFARPRCCELEASEADALESHLADCAECGPLAQIERQIDDRIVRVMRAVPVPAGLRERLLSRLAKEKWAVRRKWLVRGAVAAAIVLAIGLGIYWQRSQLTRLELDPLAQEQGLDADRLEAWYHSHGRKDVVVPRQFNYAYLQYFGFAELQERRVPDLRFFHDGNVAHVFILSADQFDLEQQEQDMAQGSNRTVRLLRHPENRRIAYLVIFTGPSLEAFFKTQSIL